VDVFTFMLYEAAYQAANMFQHANLSLPLGLERVLNKIVVTPRMHGIHHSVVSDEVGSNFSVIFRWWDALHRTLKLNVPQQDIKIGVAGYLSPDHNRLWQLVVLPFRFSKNYWLWPDGTEPVRTPSPTSGRPGIIVD
jgi:sterol desaturase/sphingolipid hydroxylase (fatty acid hydroxylase superfamily)